MKRFIVTFMASLLIAVPAVAQEVTEEPTPTVEATATDTATPTEVPTLTPTPDVIIIDGSDLEPIIDEFTDSLNEATKYANPLLALAAFLLIALMKYVFPDTTISTETIFGWVTGGFAIVYALAEFAGALPQLMDGVSVLNQLAGPALQLAIILFLPSGFRYLSWKWNIPGLNAKQGNQAFALEPQEQKAA